MLVSFTSQIIEMLVTRTKVRIFINRLSKEERLVNQRISSGEYNVYHQRGNKSLWNPILVI